MTLTECNSGPKDVAVLFVDLVNSSVFASVLGLREYAEYLQTFHETCLRQCDHFFKTHLRGNYREGEHYTAKISGDELLVMMHTEKGYNDVYQLTCLAVMLKAAWLGAPVNLDRIRQRKPAAEISAGIHHGPVWTEWKESSFDYCGYGINLAKRIEGLSREGQHYHIFLSDQAFKQVHFRLRNLIFTPRLRFDAKGILGVVGMYELAHCFLNLEPRIAPKFAEATLPIVEEIVKEVSQDSWIHDLFQVWSEGQHGRVTDEAMELCGRVLRHSPDNLIALHFMSQAHRERGDTESARVLLETLVSRWPQFGDGYLELGRLLIAMGKTESARDPLLKARLLGVDEAKDLLSDTTG